LALGLHLIVERKTQERMRKVNGVGGGLHPFAIAIWEQAFNRPFFFSFSRWRVASLIRAGKGDTGNNCIAASSEPTGDIAAAQFLLQ
jgi:hypothetical protein